MEKTPIAEFPTMASKGKGKGTEAPVEGQNRISRSSPGTRRPANTVEAQDRTAEAKGRVEKPAEKPQPESQKLAAPTQPDQPASTAEQGQTTPAPPALPVVVIAPPAGTAGVTPQPDAPAEHHKSGDPVNTHFYPVIYTYPVSVTYSRPG